MKMNFRPDKSLSARHYGWRVSSKKVFLLVLLFAVGLLGHSAVRGGLESPVIALTYPLLAFNRALNDSTLIWREYLSEHKDLTTRNVQLQAENERLKLELLSAEQLAEDYRHLRSTLGERLALPGEVVAKVISGPGRSPFDILLLDLGSANSTSPVTLGRMVLSGDVLLGQIVEVDERVSKAKLFSSAGVEVPVVIGPEKVPATAKGRGGGNFVALLPRGTTVALGDLVTVPAFGGKLIATVGSVDNDPEEPLQTIYLKSPINLFTLTWVEIYAR